ncbi:MAG: PmoA family protein [Acidobacteria bacterium]|nr:PmoA family protein [Acidobacteriota bacterium]
MKKLFGALVAVSPLWAQLSWKELDGGRLQLLDAGKPALVYNYDPQLPAGVPEDRRRCCYIHPVYTPAGVAVTDDFPKDHYHHRGVFWSWPQVFVDGGPRLDSWMMKGITTRHERFVEKSARRLVVENGWYAGDTKIVKEFVTIEPRAANGKSREFVVTLMLEATAKPVRIVGAPESGKGYGGVSVRFAPRQGTTLRTSEGQLKKDEDLVPHAWAELEASYQGRVAALRVTADPANPGEPNVWCLRFYGFIGASWPARTGAVIEPGKAAKLRYTISAADR